MKACAPARIARAALLALAGAASPFAALALDLDLPPGAIVVQSSTPAPGQHEFATEPWRGGGFETRDVAGEVARRTWRIEDAELSVVGVAEALEAQLVARGFEIALSCQDRACGGFDFRQRLDMGRSPEMYVDIGNFRYISAFGDDDERAVAVIVSRGAETIYVHVAHVGTGIEASPVPSAGTQEPSEPAISAAGDVPLIERLLSQGAAPLNDLGFRTGASDLDGTDYASLAALAAFLAEDGQRRVVLVGHTDSEGGRESNIALSQARAAAVRRHLIGTLGTDPAQVEAAGIGYLSPRASNDTAEGREANRRVEVVLLNAG